MHLSPDFWHTTRGHENVRIEKLALIFNRPLVSSASVELSRVDDRTIPGVFTRDHLAFFAEQRRERALCERH
jgi:hypothetical protein